MNIASTERCPPVRSYLDSTSAKLRPKVPVSPFKPIRVSTKPRCRVRRISWGLSNLYSIAKFLQNWSIDGPPSIVLEKTSETQAVYILGTTLHVHVLKLRKKEEVNLILLATQLQLVDEVRIHSFHLHYYLTPRRTHVRITPSHWETVRFVLPYINRGPLVERNGKKERAVRITFDEFLRPAINARKAGKPYEQLIHDIPEYETDLISTYHKLPYFHCGPGTFASSYSSESEQEVDIEFEEDEERNEAGDEIMMILGYPFFPNRGE